MGRFFTFERRLALGAFLATLPGLVLASVLAWRALPAGPARVLLLVGAIVLSVVVIAQLRGRIIRRLKTLSNLVSALREGDYSVRGRDADRIDPLGEVLWEVNALGDQLRTERLGELEASALLGQVLEEIDVGIFAFDGTGELRLVNRAGARLLQRPPSQLIGRDAESAGDGPSPGGRDATAGGDRLRRTGRPVRATPLAVPARGPAAHAGGPGRPPPGGARGGTRGLAAHRPGAEPRDQQLARPHPEHRLEPPGGPGQGRPRRVARRRALRPHRGRSPERGALALPRRLCPTRAAAPPHAGRR